MRIQRQRMFRITVNGTDSWVEPAGSRVAEELQHHLVTEDYLRCSVRVKEFYSGGAKPRLVLEDESL